MANVDKGIFMQKNNLALIVSAVLLLLFIVFTVLNINLTIGYVLLVLFMMAGFFGIMPHIFEDES